MRCPIGILFSIILSPLIVFLLVVEKVKLQRPRFTRVSVSETENVEVLNVALFMTQNAAASQAITFQDRSFPLVFPIPKPEPFIQSTGHSLEAD